MRFIRMFAFSVALAAVSLAARYGLEHGGKIVRISDPQISTDGKSIALVVEHANYEDNRYDSDLALIDIGTRGQRLLTHARRRVRQPRWSPDGSRLAFVSAVDGKQQVFVLPMGGGDPWQVTKSPTAIQQYAWRPGGQDIAFVAEDEAPKRTGEERHNKSFEVQNNHFLLTDAPRPSHLWIAPAAGGAAPRLTSGPWPSRGSRPPSAATVPRTSSPAVTRDR